MDEVSKTTSLRMSKLREYNRDESPEGDEFGGSLASMQSGTRIVLRAYGLIARQGTI